MTGVSIATWEARLGDVTLPIEAGNISIDELNVPAITASIIVPNIVAGLIDTLDPRQTPVPRVTISGRRTWWASQTLADLTAYLSAGVTTMADLSTLWSGKTLANITDMFAAHLDPVNGQDADQTMSLDLHVREVAEDVRGDTLTVALASDEALLTDWGPTDGLDFAAIGQHQEALPEQQVRTWVDPILLVVLGYRTEANAYSTTALSAPYGDVINRTLDMSAWEMIRQPLDDTDLKLRVSRDGTGFSLQLPVNEIPGKEWISLLTNENTTEVRKVRSRNDDWYDSVGLVAGDAIADRVFKGGPTGLHSRTYRERFPDGTRLTSSMVVNINTRSANRGQFIDITAPIQMGVFMMDEFTWEPTAADTPEPWRIQAVSYDIFADQMNIRGVQRY